MLMQLLRIPFNVFSVQPLRFHLLFIQERQRKLAEHENVDIRFAITINLRVPLTRLRFSVNLYYERVTACVYMIYNVSFKLILCYYVLYFTRV